MPRAGARGRGRPPAVGSAAGRGPQRAGPRRPDEPHRRAATVCTPTGIDVGKRKNILPLVDLCRGLYDNPTVTTWLEAFRMALTLRARTQVAATPTRRGTGYSPPCRPTPTTLWPPSSRRRAPADTAVAPPAHAVMTVHRAKGNEFDTVVLPVRQRLELRLRVRGRQASLRRHHSPATRAAPAALKGLPLLMVPHLRRQRGWALRG